jgi:prepilin-type processing-associated H-X9-DG protein/prepilin-type N-terminal cleavage/methylation domain-containing protein
VKPLRLDGKEYTKMLVFIAPCFPKGDLPMRRTSFTLIELLVVVAIIALLIAILLPSLAKARALGKAVSCQSNLRQVGLGLQTYGQSNNDFFPVAHGNNFSAPVVVSGADVPTQEWYAKLTAYNLTREAMLCSEDPEAKKPASNTRSYIFNDLFAFGKGISRIETPSRKIVISERADQDGSDIAPAIDDTLFNGLCYHPWTNVSAWSAMIKDGRHNNRASNFLFADSHVEPLQLAKTISPDTSATAAKASEANMHYVAEFAR